MAIQLAGYLPITTIDYPGKLATICFTKGCNFRCPFCQNKSLVTELDPDSPMDYTKEFLQYVKRREKMLDGIVISGGEPCIHGDELIEFLKVLKSEFAHTPVKLDTNGYYTDTLKTIINENLVDYIAMDVKGCKETYAKLCPIKDSDASLLFNKILCSIAVIKNSPIPHEFRTTYVKGIHTRKDVEAIRECVSGAQSYYIQSYSYSDGVIDPSGLESFSKIELYKIAELFENYVMKATVRDIK